MDTPGRIIVCLLVLTIIGDLTARWYGHVHQNKKTPVFHFYNIAEMLLIATYYILLIWKRKKLWYIILSIIVFSALGLLNIIYLQPLNRLNSNFLILESFFTIAFSLYSLYRILLDDDIIKVLRFPHFWISALLLLLASGSFFFWTVVIQILKDHRHYLLFAENTQMIINIIVYLGIGLSFLLYHKKEPAL